MSETTAVVEAQEVVVMNGVLAGAGAVGAVGVGAVGAGKKAKKKSKNVEAEVEVEVAARPVVVASTVVQESAPEPESDLAAMAREAMREMREEREGGTHGAEQPITVTPPIVVVDLTLEEEVGRIPRSSSPRAQEWIDRQGAHDAIAEEVLTLVAEPAEPLVPSALDVTQVKQTPSLVSTTTTITYPYDDRISPKDITADPEDNVCRPFGVDAFNVEKLAASIIKLPYGQIQNCIVADRKDLNKNGKRRLIAGFQRFAADLLIYQRQEDAGVPFAQRITVPCKVLPHDVDPAIAEDLNIAENIAKVGMTAMERAWAMRAYQSRHKLTETAADLQKIGDFFLCDRATVFQAFRMTKELSKGEQRELHKAGAKTDACLLLATFTPDKRKAILEQIEADAYVAMRDAKLREENQKLEQARGEKTGKSVSAVSVSAGSTPTTATATATPVEGKIYQVTNADKKTRGDKCPACAAGTPYASVEKTKHVTGVRCKAAVQVTPVPAAVVLAEEVQAGAGTGVDVGTMGTGDVDTEAVEARQEGTVVDMPAPAPTVESLPAPEPAPTVSASASASTTTAPARPPRKNRTVTQPPEAINVERVRQAAFKLDIEMPGRVLTMKQWKTMLEQIVSVDAEGEYNVKGLNKRRVNFVNKMLECADGLVTQKKLVDILQEYVS